MPFGTSQVSSDAGHHRQRESRRCTPKSTQASRCRPRSIPLSLLCNSRPPALTRWHCVQGAISYASGVIHHVKLKHLKPGHTYFYRCGDPDFPGQWSRELNFTMPRATGRHEFPFRLGVIADIGQTYNSTGMRVGATYERPTPSIPLAPCHQYVQPCLCAVD